MHKSRIVMSIPVVFYITIYKPVTVVTGLIFHDS